MRPIIYVLTILIVPGGFLFCAMNVWNRRQKRLRLDESYRDKALDEQSLMADWERAEPYGKGSASTYVPDWAKPLASPGKSDHR